MQYHLGPRPVDNGNLGIPTYLGLPLIRTRLLRNRHSRPGPIQAMQNDTYSYRNNSKRNDPEDPCFPFVIPTNLMGTLSYSTPVATTRAKLGLTGPPFSTMSTLVFSSTSPTYGLNPALISREVWLLGQKYHCGS